MERAEEDGDDKAVSGEFSKPSEIFTNTRIDMPNFTTALPGAQKRQMDITGHHAALVAIQFSMDTDGRVILQNDVMWGDLDMLIIDTPPGTSDEQISTIEELKGHRLDGAVIVTTPQQVSVVDVRKELSFAGKMGVPIIGIVENMAGFVCPCCQVSALIPD